MKPNDISLVKTYLAIIYNNIYILYLLIIYLLYIYIYFIFT